MRSLKSRAALVAIGLAAWSPAPTAGQGLTFSRERLARIDRALQGYVDSGQIAGAVVLVLRNGTPAYQAAFGWADKEAGTRLRSDALFRIASQTKAVTSVAAMLLVEEGRLGLADPVATWMPGLAKAVVSGRADSGRTAPLRRPITIRDLLTHTAGLSYGTQPWLADGYRALGLGPAAGYGWYTADKDEPICASMDRLGTAPLPIQPGEGFMYGYATDVLGCVIERVSGVPLDRFFETRIFGPLGMGDTHFFVPPEKASRLAAVHRLADGALRRADTGSRGQGHYLEGPRKSFAGGAGLVSTARDYARFLEMLRRGGELDGVRLLSPTTVRLMTANQVGTLFSTDGLGFGLGFQTVDRPGAGGSPEAPGAFGWGGAYQTNYSVDPANGLVLVLMSQHLPNVPLPLGARFRALVYQALVPGAVAAGRP